MTPARWMNVWLTIVILGMWIGTIGVLLWTHWR